MVTAHLASTRFLEEGVCGLGECQEETASHIRGEIMRLIRHKDRCHHRRKEGAEGSEAGRCVGKTGINVTVSSPGWRRENMSQKL